MTQADVVLEGGGVKGIALVGALTAFAEAGYAFGRVAGTSAGAIVGSLLAAGMPVERMRDVMAATDYRRFADTAGVDRVPLLGKAASLLLEQGIYEGREVRDWVAGHLAELGVRTFGDPPLVLPADPGADAPEEERSRLVVMASDVSLRRLVRLPWDYLERYGMDPAAVEVADAVRASMSIPFFFEPVRLRYRGAGGAKVESVLVDGGMLSNFPVEVFDRSDGRPPRWPTFGIKLSTRAANRAQPRPVSGTLGLTMSMLATLTSFHDAAYVDRPDVQARTVFVDTLGVRSTDFDLDADTQERLFRNGHDAARRFLGGWDFAAYVSRFRS